VTGCVLSGIACAPPVDERAHDPDREHGLLCCAPSLLRLASALNVIPDRVDELGGHGFVVRDGRPGTRAVLVDGQAVRVPAMADPVANLWPAGPVPGQRGGARVHAAPASSPPLSLDAVDLTSRVNHEARRLLARGVLGLDDDQVGHLSAATILHGWVRDWADIRREGEPMPVVREMCRWLADRLDWAAARHPALDEFAGEVLELRGVLTALTGRGEPPPETLSAPCPSCGLLSLYRDDSLERVVCGGGCAERWTDEEYAAFARSVIEAA
jgi:endogenous inhibitor of DNA gyrase (YacG/DUF329 family)